MCTLDRYSRRFLPLDRISAAYLPRPNFELGHQEGARASVLDQRALESGFVAWRRC